MRPKTEFLLLTLVGIVLLLIAGYTQWVSTASGQIVPTPAEWRSGPWWTIVGLPSLSGILYMVAAYVGNRVHIEGKARLYFFLGCEIFAIALLLSIGGVGILATVFCTLILVYVLLKSRRAGAT